MKIPYCARQFVIFFAVIALFFPEVARASTSHDINQQLRSAIAKVRKGKTPADRRNAAERLASVTDERDCAAVTDETIHSVVSLLDIEDDIVQMWVAAALGDIGPRAKASVPKLLSILAVSDCKMWDISSAASIPVALKKMGVTPPPRNCHY
jgi:hypothetical protein